MDHAGGYFIDAIFQNASFMNTIILASQSPRRKQLLEWAHVPFDIVVADTDESFPPGLGYADIAQHIARHKALAVKERLGSHRSILAADTIVVCESELLGKPTDRADAIRMLEKLAGRKHDVITGVAFWHADRMHTFADRTEVNFHPLTAEQIAFYVDAYKPYDKAGAYAIQEWIGVAGIQSIHGDFYNVMGLPVSRVLRLLQECGVL